MSCHPGVTCVGALAAVLVACQGPSPEPSPVTSAVEHLEGATLPADADLSVPPDARLTFDPGWQEQVIGTIYGGSTLGLFASPERFPLCGASGRVTAFVRFDGGSALEVPLAASETGWPAANVTVPAEARELEVWLRAERDDGCLEWDSDLGRNYRFQIHAWQPTLVHFNGDWSEVADAPLVAGGVLVVDYDLDRLPACRALGHYGLPAWDVLAHVRFDDGHELTHSAAFPVTSSGAVLDRVGGLALFPIPAAARGVEIWFENSQTLDPPYQPEACEAWDSNFGSNYTFPIVAAAEAPLHIGWAGDFDFTTFHRPPAQHLGDVDPAYYFDSMSGSELSTWMEAQVFVPGLSDRAYASPDAAAEAARGLVLAQAVTDAFPGEVDGWGVVDLPAPRQEGNNFVYRFDFWRLRFAIYHDPPIPTGLHHYYFRFSVDGGATWFTAGREGGRARRFVVAPALDCTLFPDHPPAGCPPVLAVGWAGNWGGRFTHECSYRAELPDPVIFTKSALGHDCMVVSAEVWVPGLTDAGDAPAGLRAEVETDIGFGGGPLAATTTYPLTFEGRVGNNFRYSWDLGEHVGRSDRGDYRYRFRFSVDDGSRWYVIGATDGPDGDFRTLWVRNDSLDTGAE